jgi:thiol:disulfide interchange protein DsbD
MKKSVILVALVILQVVAFSQKLNPAHWTFSAVKKSDKQYEIVMSANIDAPWHLYSQFMKQGGPVPTSFKFKTNPIVKLDGAVKEKGKLEKFFDKNFNMQVSYFAGKVDFVQTVTLKVASKTKLTGEVEYMTCNDEKCLPPVKLPFEIDIQ